MPLAERYIEKWFELLGLGPTKKPNPEKGWPRKRGHKNQKGFQSVRHFLAGRLLFQMSLCSRHMPSVPCFHRTTYLPLSSNGACPCGWILSV